MPAASSCSMAISTARFAASSKHSL
jgi:hypothetical protein